MKKRLDILLVGCLMFSLTACAPDGNGGQPMQTQKATQTQETTLQESGATEQELPVDEGQEQKENQVQTADTKPTEKADVSVIDDKAEMKADELLDLFISGSINAVDPADSTLTFYITDLNMDSEEWDAYSVGEKIDLDNDGENELILNGPYGGIYLDARDGQVYGFAAGEGYGFTLSYTYFRGAIWILYSNRMHQGYESYHMELFEGADNLVEEMNFNEELIDENNVEGPEKYYLNGTEITYDEYLELSSEIFDAQVTTN